MQHRHIACSFIEWSAKYIDGGIDDINSGDFLNSLSEVNCCIELMCLQLYPIPSYTSPCYWQISNILDLACLFACHRNYVSIPADTYCRSRIQLISIAVFCQTGLCCISKPTRAWQYNAHRFIEEMIVAVVVGSDYSTTCCSGISSGKLHSSGREVGVLLAGLQISEAALLGAKCVLPCMMEGCLLWKCTTWVSLSSLRRCKEASRLQSKRHISSSMGRASLFAKSRSMSCSTRSWTCISTEVLLTTHVEDSTSNLPSLYIAP